MTGIAVPEGGRSIDTMDLVVFVAVVRAGSLGAAATALAMSGPSVSGRIAGLERKLNTRLFERTPRGSTMTPAGERLLDYARRCLDLLDEAALNVPASERQRLVLAAPASLGDLLFPSAITALAGMPVKAHCRVAHSGEVVGRLIDGSVHAGFVIAKVPLRTLGTERLCRSRFVVAASPEHPLAGERGLHPHDLVDAQLVVYRWGREAQDLAATFDDPDGRAPAPVVHTTGSPAAAVRLAVSSGYVAVVPAIFAASALADGRLLELAVQLDDWTLEVNLVYALGARDRLGVRALLDNLPVLRAALGEG